MTPTILSLMIDILVLAGLGVTIFYALRLSRALKNFRQGRAEFETLIKELNQSIERAHNALSALHKVTSANEGGVKAQIEDAKRITEELKQVNASSSHLANRMQNLASQSRETIDQSNVQNALEQSDENDTDDYNERLYQSLAAVEARAQEDDGEVPSFLKQDQSQSDDVGSDVQSQAEKDLLQAIENNKRSMG